MPAAESEFQDGDTYVKAEEYLKLKADLKAITEEIETFKREVGGVFKFEHHKVVGHEDPMFVPVWFKEIFPLIDGQFDPKDSRVVLSRLLRRLEDQT